MASSISSEPLVDGFGRRVDYVRVSVTDRCNFRCVYCMPAEGTPHAPRADLLSFEEIEAIVRYVHARGVRKVRITGGEPLVRQGVVGLVERLGQLDDLHIAMTTNAFLLERHLDALIDAGLDSLNISLDTLDPDQFTKVTRVGSLDRVVRAIDRAVEADFGPVKLNAVVVGGINDHEVVPLAEFAIERGVPMRYIEFMPIGAETIWDAGPTQCFPAEEMRRALAERWELVPDPSRYGAGPARYWRLHGHDTPSVGHPIGIISAVTECFCSGCNRVRITPQGGLRMCLADDDESGLRDAMRLAPNADAAMRAIHELFEAALAGKKERHAFDLDGGAVTRVHMSGIGG
jgi:cyclic pyranopterin phosphate synthase